jgi:RimJ/RimL family protein N-acetyltransferase
MLDVFIKTERLIIKNITKEDVSSNYLRWLQDEINLKFIVSANETNSLENLKNYIEKKNLEKDVIFLAIFDVHNKLHIGNVKFEPVNIIKKYAVMGILIGNSDYKGIGIAEEVLTNTFQFLYKKLSINMFLLGVNIHNIPAIKAYKKIGFRISNSNILKPKSNDAIIMEFVLLNKELN